METYYCGRQSTKSRRFPVFPEAISNSRRFPGFPGVADTLDQGISASDQRWLWRKKAALSHNLNKLNVMSLLKLTNSTSSECDRQPDRQRDVDLFQ